MDSSAMSVRQLVAQLGRPEIMAACGVKTQAVTNWIRNNSIPSQHYLAVQRQCREKGVESPDHLFFESAA